MVPITEPVVVGLCLEGQEPSAGDLEHALSRRFPAAAWSVRVVAAPPLPPYDGRPVPATDLLAAGRELLLHDDLDVVVLLTSRRLELHDEEVTAHASPLQQVVVLHGGGVEEAAALVGEMLELEGTSDDAEVLSRLSAPSSSRASLRDLLGHAPLVVRVVGAARPWLLFRHLTRTLTGAAAAAAVAVITPDFWMLADRMGAGRLVGLTVLGLVAAVAVIVLGGNLRERGRGRSVRVHNAAVWISVVLGVLALYGVLLVGGLALALLVLPWSLVASTVGHAVGWGTLVRIGVLISTGALVGSVLGAGLEDDAELHEALFGGSDDARFAS